MRSAVLSAMCLAVSPIAIGAPWFDRGTGSGHWCGGYRLSVSARGEVGTLALFDDGSGLALYAGGIGDLERLPAYSPGGVARWTNGDWRRIGGLLPVAAQTPVTVHAFAVHDDGKGPALYVGGEFTLPGHVSQVNIARWNGKTWVKVSDHQPDGPVYALRSFQVASVPALIVGGNFLHVGPSDFVNIASWDGASWSSLDNGLRFPGFPEFAAVLTLTEFESPLGTRLIAGGYFSQAGQATANNIAAWNGAEWTPLGEGIQHPSLPSVVLALTSFVVDGVNNLIVGGNFTLDATGGTAHNVTRWDGKHWRPSGTGLEDSVYALTSQPTPAGSRLVAAGRFVLTDQSIGVAVLEDQVWAPLGGGVSHQVISLPRGKALLHSETEGVNGLLVGGLFDHAGATPADGVARWNGVEWRSIEGLGDGVDGEVRALTRWTSPGGTAFVVAGGTMMQSGASLVQRVATWDGAEWRGLGAGLQGHAVVAANAVTAHGSDLYVGGEFVTTGPAPIRNIARWDGAAWRAVGEGLNGTVRAVCSFGDDLIAAGDFTASGVTPLNHVARWNGAVWTQIGPGLDGRINALSLYDAGSGPELIAAGGFALSGGQVVRAIARWDGSLWKPLGSGLNLACHALAVRSEGTGSVLFAGGDFTVAGGNPVQRIASWNGKVWSALPGAGPIGRVSALAIGDEGAGDVYAGGSFVIPSLKLARVGRFDGTTWHALDEGIDGSVLVLLPDHTNGLPHLYVGGRFERAGAHMSSNFGQWRERNECVGDADGDRVILFSDLNLVLSDFGTVGAGIDADVNCDGVVNADDLTIILSGYGGCS